MCQRISADKIASAQCADVFAGLLLTTHRAASFISGSANVVASRIFLTFVKILGILISIMKCCFNILLRGNFQEGAAMLSGRLKVLRKSASYTQKNIADFLGIDRSTYSYYESGKTEPSSSALARLSNLYHVSMDELIPGACKSAEVLELRSPDDTIHKLSEGAKPFSSLSKDEMLLVMFFRECENKTELVTLIKDFNSREEKEEK